MTVLVTSHNPVKLAATKKAFATYFPDKKINYIDRKFPSGVAEQPMSVEETAMGAVNRAKNATAVEADFIVSIEGGLSRLKIGDHEYGFEQTWACVLDPKTGLSEIGSGPAFPILPHVLQALFAGENLTDAMASHYGTVDLGKNQGYNGWLSNNVIDREEASFAAIYLALCALLKEEKK
jgi:inosine/xanthosine triphosphatase